MLCCLTRNKLFVCFFLVGNFRFTESIYLNVFNVESIMFGHMYNSLLCR